VASDAARLGRERLLPLEQQGFELVERYDLIRARNDEAAITAALAGAWGVVAGSQRLSRTVIERSPSLRVIARTGSGFETVDVDAATSQKVAVLITPHQNSESVADLTLALMLATLREVVKLDQMTRSGAWRDRIAPAADLHSATVGIVGLGHIGRAVARRLTGFSCRLFATEPSPPTEFCKQLGIGLLPLEELLPKVDVLTIHVPFSNATRRLIGKRELELLQPHSVLVNTSRGGIVDEGALVDALRNGQLAGAGLDVYEHEPLPPEGRLATLPNVVLTPHVASYSKSAVTQVADAVVEGLLDVAAGRTPAGSVNGLPLGDWGNAPAGNGCSG
jgi:phosphoglycerate dehydrogenase-like enzyme